MNKDQYIVPKEDPLTILDSKSAVCMANNVNDTKHISHIARWIHLVRNGQKCKMHNIEWCEVGLQWSDIVTKNIGVRDLIPSMKYIILRLDNWERTLVQEEVIGCRKVYGKNVLYDSTRFIWGLEKISLKFLY